MNDIRNTWRQLNLILHRYKHIRNKFQLEINGSISFEKKEIANTFNKYFSSVADNLRKKIPKVNNIFQDYFK